MEQLYSVPFSTRSPSSPQPYGPLSCTLDSLLTNYLNQVISCEDFSLGLSGFVRQHFASPQQAFPIVFVQVCHSLLTVLETDCRNGCNHHDHHGSISRQMIDLLRYKRVLRMILFSEIFSFSTPYPLPPHSCSSSNVVPPSTSCASELLPAALQMLIETFSTLISSSSSNCSSDGSWRTTTTTSCVNGDDANFCDDGGVREHEGKQKNGNEDGKHGDSNGNSFDWCRQTCECALVVILLDCCFCCCEDGPRLHREVLLDNATCVTVLDYLLQWIILPHCLPPPLLTEPDTHWDTVLYAVIALEKCLLLTTHDDETTKNRSSSPLEHLYEELLNVLPKLMAQLEQHSRVAQSMMEPCVQQLSLCTHWMLDHYIYPEPPSHFLKQAILPPIKLSPEGLSARCDTSKPFTVRSEYIINSGVYFYEVVLLSCGSMRLGWCNKESGPFEDAHCLLGEPEDRHSIGFDGYHKCVWHRDSVRLPDIAQWRVGDVVGCLIDVDACKFVFYLNGLPIHYRIDLFESYAWFAAATLTTYQQVYFNFGQETFRFPPHGVLYKDMHGESHGNVRIYRLLEPTLVYIRKAFVHFSDDIQVELDKVITKWLTKRTSCLNLPDILLNPEFIKYEQGILRLSQSMINLRNNDHLENRLIKEDLYYYYDKLFWVYFIESNLSKINILAKFIKMIQPIIGGELNAFDDIIHRNLCLIMLILLEHCKYSMKQEISDRILDYLLRIIEESKRMEAVLYAVIGVECRLVNIIQFDLNPQLRKRVVDSLSQLATDLSPDQTSVQSSSNSYRYQVSFCARWTLEHVLVPTNLLAHNLPPRFAPVKLSLDRLSARCEDSLQYMFVRSSFAFISGVHFYEVTLLTGGLIRIGWASKACRLEEYKHLGDDRQSIGFNGYDRWIWHGKPVTLKNVPRWQAGDVIGCLIDCESRKLVFYLNGHPIPFNDVDFLTNFPPPYFAAAFLFPHQQCWFNFGQQPFQHPPKHTAHYGNFHSATEGNVNRYRLEYVSTKDEIWHRFEQDNTQLVYDQWVAELEGHVAADYYEEEYFNVTLLEKFASLMNVDQGRLRLYHSIIRLLGCNLKGDKLDILVGWIEHYSTPKIDQWSSMQLIQLINSLVEIPLMAGLANDQKQQNVCIVLFLMIRNTLVYLNHRQTQIHPEDFFNEVYYFLTQCLKHSENQWTLLFAVNCFQILARNEVNRSNMLNDKNLMQILSEYAHYFNDCSIQDIYNRNFEYMKYQIGFCANVCLEALSHHPNSEAESVSSLHSDDSARFCHLSTDRISARGDWESERFRSNTTFVSGIYFYEAILLTSGSMRIGWATTEFEMEKFAICLDLYQRCVWHAGNRTHIATLPHWKVGDVIGCVLDIDKSKFYFYLNGVKIDLRRSGVKFVQSSHFYAKPYFAAVALSGHQQCCLNFGNEPFKYPPKRGVIYER